MSKGYLLDTNIAIAILVNEASVVEFTQQAMRDKVKIFFSVVSECEVIAGLTPAEQLRLEKLFTSRRSIPVTSQIAKAAGRIRREQREKGRKLKTPDALIIATALVNELSLLSRDSDMRFVQDELGIPIIQI
ncbi:type II toxin-antitoxin system VapC family toxin [Paenibacillus sp. GCM10023252]|uniref:type II toxin-antitoxin system VapC family toxin n=1 Tax=Paenibacillus sp. GCM10023252 TaxID=3252649 RepID=UPI00361801DE